MSKKVVSVLIGLLMSNIGIAQNEGWDQQVQMRETSLYRGMNWTAVGPKMQGGRVEALDVPLLDPKTIYAGFGSGSLWKSVNHGLSWKLITKQQSSFSIGDVASAPSNPEIVWVGTGENLLARSSYAGTGVFKSLDGGETWQHMGLSDIHHTGRIIIHPQNPDIVYVAALGHQFSFNEERGVFKTINGGRTWSKVLYINDKSGVNDLVMDPVNPEILIASSWEHDRKAWNNVDAGNGSGLYKTTDGGKSWKRLTQGFPQGDMGRIGIEISLSHPKVIYAMVDNQNLIGDSAEKNRKAGGELYRSENGGESWKRMNEQPIPGAGYSFCDVRIDPKNPDRVFVALNNLLASENGGKTFRRIGGKVIHQYPHNTRALHLDEHELWVDPFDGDHWILGNDGGIYQSWDAGDNWAHHNGLPVAEFYAISVDDSIPYNIYGGTQDNEALYGPAREIEDEVGDGWNTIWIDLWGGGDSYYTWPDPVESGGVYFEQQWGDIQYKNLITGEHRRIRPEPLEGEELRCTFVTPFILSKHNPNTLYFGAQRLFKSMNRGESWRAISPDLSTEEGRLKTGNVPYATITTLSESPLNPDLIYAGTDDGAVQVTRDGGNIWKSINTTLPRKWVSRILASRFNPGTVYLTLSGFRDDEFMAYVYKSKDYGENWIDISQGLPMVPMNVIIEDPRYKEVIYLGGEPGIYVSTDGGESWNSLVADLPTAAIHDLVIQERELELIAGTHGLSCFMLDIGAIRPADHMQSSRLHLFQPKPARLPKPKEYGGDWVLETRRKALISFWSPKDTHASLIIVNQKGEEVFNIDLEAKSGLNQVKWDLEIKADPVRSRLNYLGNHFVPPGNYRVVIKTAEELCEGELSVAGG